MFYIPITAVVDRVTCTLCTWTLALPTTGTKLVSPIQRGTIRKQ